jgi:hypothetical protein
MDMAGRHDQPDQRRKYHERHDPRFHQFEIIAGAGNAGCNAGVHAGVADFRWGKGYAHRISGSVSY